MRIPGTLSLTGAEVEHRILLDEMPIGSVRFQTGVKGWAAYLGDRPVGIFHSPETAGAAIIHEFVENERGRS